MNLESEGEWDEYWVVSCFFFFFIHFILLNRYLHIFICISIYISMYEYSYFDLILFHVDIENAKKTFTQKKKYQENLKTS